MTWLLIALLLLVALLFAVLLFYRGALRDMSDLTSFALMLLADHKFYQAERQLLIERIAMTPAGTADEFSARMRIAVQDIAHEAGVKGSKSTLVGLLWELKAHSVAH